MLHLRRLLLILPILLPALLVTRPAAAADWSVDHKASSIAFSGTHAGNSFNGRFDSWQADIRFNPEDLDASKAVVSIDLASARTGDKSYDGTLPGADWFNVRQFARATYTTTGFRHLGGKRYEADGLLNMRGVTLPLKLAFTLAIEGNSATMTGTTSIKRVAWGLGKGPDATGEWVSLDIPVTVKLSATRAAE